MATVMAISAVLRSSDLSVLNQALTELAGGAADFFEQEFAVADVAPLEAEASRVDWPALVQLFKSHRINLVAVRNAPASLHEQILACGLSLETAAAGREEAGHPAAHQSAVPVPSSPAAAPVPAPAAPAAGTMIIDTPVRAGQRLYARGADLVITAAVNNGAEVIADGSIHIYAPLRGRALAGASGNAQARIFAFSMEAELVSIAGIYRTFENGVPENVRQQPVQIRSVGDRIDIASLGPAART